MNHSTGVYITDSSTVSVLENTLLSNGIAVTDTNDPTNNVVAENLGYYNLTFYEGSLTDEFIESNNKIFVPPIPLPIPVYSCCQCDTGKVVPCFLAPVAKAAIKNVAKTETPVKTKGTYIKLSYEQLKSIWENNSRR
jgi:hypothetical protein